MTFFLIVQVTSVVLSAEAVALASVESAFVYGEYIENGKRKLAFKRIADDEDIPSVQRAHDLWDVLDKGMGMTAEKYGYKPAKKKK